MFAFLVHTIGKGRRTAPGHRILDRETLWRLPAVLSSVAVPALLCWPHLRDFPSGTFARETLATGLAAGTCCMLLGLGLGIWIAIRVRTGRALMAAAWSAVVAATWWWVVYEPLLRGRVLD